VTKTKLCNEVLNIAEIDTSVELWHKRLGHMFWKGMHSLARMDYLPDLKGISLKPFSHCFAGKQQRAAFRTLPSHCVENVLDIVHTNVCSMTKNSHGGALYFVTFIEEQDIKVFVYVLKHKYQTLEAFKDFHDNIERETGRKLKCIRSDNGCEYRCPLERYCSKFGIGLEKSPPKTPQLNGLAERMNRADTPKEGHNYVLSCTFTEFS